MSKNIKILIAVLVAAVLSIPIGILVVDKSTPKDKIYEGVTVNGLELGNLTKKQAIEQLEKNYNNQVKNKNIKVVYKDFSYNIDYKSLNAHYDIESAAKVALDYGKNGNAFTRFFTRFTLKNKPTTINLKFLADDSRIKEDVKTIAKKIDKKPSNAKISYNGTFNITDEKTGLKVDQKKLESDLKKAINPSKKEEVVNVPVNEDKPKVTADMLKSIDTKIHGFETKFDPNNTNRAGNIRLAAESISGSVVLPGEVFSTNSAMGPRVKSNGYKEAPTIVDGTLTPGLGGGICQVSTTLYNAALLSDLEIVERRPHSLKVGYVPASRDAVISEDYIDLKFRNNTGYPIYIQGSVYGSYVSMSIYGSSKAPKKSVKITEEVYKTIPSKSGKKPQIKSRAYRKVYDVNGNLIREEKLSSDHYKG
ncbi:VanW family protein [Clostridium cylindrosporum]|uniref:VanW family protein n=1 Tax=Clostridium cylindrosporum DSM 605 TaxID=1121307 RepID=A0A0J8D8Y8_CLOCY|nr:VanW family protein [Clostridium cylindrosporum]KMT20819.1 VanW family protein [Clostridium cylindrosporum DSM 605]